MHYGFRVNMAHNSYYTLASMQGTEKLGRPEAFMMPPLPAKVLGRQNINDFAKNIEAMAGL